MAKMQPWVKPMPPEGEVDLKYIMKNGKYMPRFEDDPEHKDKAQCYGYAIEAKNGDERGVLFFIPLVSLCTKGGK